MPKKLNIQKGDVFNWLTAMEEVPKPIKKSPSIWWKFKCKCGNEKISTGSGVRRDDVKSCGCLLRLGNSKKDLVGKRFGKLLVISYLSKSVWLCKCDCGNETRVITGGLSSKQTKSCGCLRKNPNNTVTHYQCSVCKEIKEKNKINFSTDKSNKTGFHITCKNCLNSGKKRMLGILRNYRSCDKKKQFICDIDIDFMLYFLKEGTKCYCCGIKQNKKLNILGLDRINNNLGHLKDNVLPCCLDCNAIRGRAFTSTEMKFFLGPAIKRIRKYRSKDVIKKQNH